MRQQLKITSIHEALSDLPRSTVDEFLEYHKANPAIWKGFEKFSLEVWAKGRKHYGAKAIMERVRYEVEIEIGGDFKANNNYTSYYARILVAKYPELQGFFEFRKLEGLRSAA